MSTIDEKYLKRLKDAGLFVSEPFADGHGWEHGVRVGKPSQIPGNSIPNYQGGYITIGEEIPPPEMDAPFVVLLSRSEGWIVRAQECIPQPGMGDFINVWKTADEAIQDILDFYFGDPGRMNLKAKRKEDLMKRLASQ